MVFRSFGGLLVGYLCYYYYGIIRVREVFRFVYKGLCWAGFGTGREGLLVDYVDSWGLDYNGDRFNSF